MAQRPCGDVCPIGAAGQGKASTAETMAALREVVKGAGRCVCRGTGPTRNESGERRMLLCFCARDGEPQRFYLDPEQALDLAHDLLCGLLTHNRELKALVALREELGGWDGRQGGNGADGERKE